MTCTPEKPRLHPLLEDAHPRLAADEAILEAEACLQCGGPCAAAPCVQSCPAGIDIPGFILDIAEQRPIDAAAKIFEDNILGGTCARVCPVQVLCEGSCVLLKEGRRPIGIGRLQRFATDAAMEADAEVVKSPPLAKRAERIGVIGAGPAGLACAAELAQRGFPVVVYERHQYPGGLVTRGIAPYKQQYEPLPQEVEQIERLGVEFRFGTEIGRNISVEQLRAEHAALFIGVGMGDDMPARIPGEDLPGVWESLRFIESLKLDSDVQPEVGSRVAVIGGGNTAIDVARETVMLRNMEMTSSNTAVDVARQAAMLGASEVLILYRRSEEQMPAFAHEIMAAKHEGVQIVPLVSPVEFVGDSRVTGVKCIRMQLGEPDASGRPRPEPIPDSEFVLEVDMVVKAIGQKPHAPLFEMLGVDMNRSVVNVDDDLQTSVPGIYAGGDCINGGSTVVEAVRHGRDAAKAIDRQLTGAAPPRPAPAPPTHVKTDNGSLLHFQADYCLTTVPVLCKGCNICVESCPTRTLALDATNHIVVRDTATCVFCGLCEARCPDFAIWIDRGYTERARAATAGGRQDT